MRIGFVGYKENPVNLFKDLGKSLSKKISGLDLDQRFVSLPEDIPIVALESAGESDFVLVFALIEDEEMAKFLKEKLMDVELSTKTRILKYIEVDEFFGADEEDYIEKKAALVEKISELIVNILFNEPSFEPKDKDFAL